MFLTPEYVILSVVCTILLVLVKLSSCPPLRMTDIKLSDLIAFRLKRHFKPSVSTKEDIIRHISDLADIHETAARLSDLFKKDGAETWPPRANHDHLTWPAALRPFKEIYQEMAPLLPAATPSLDDDINRARIDSFRSRFNQLLREKINLEDVTQLLAAAHAGRWDVFPRDTYNAFYCCIAWCRHAYRWGTIPAVRVAQLERTVKLPLELVSSWAWLQQNFGLNSDSGNMMSNLVLNFSPSGKYALQINVGMSPVITTSEEEFARITHEMEGMSVPVYHDVVMAIISFARGDKAACLAHVRGVAHQLRPLLSTYYGRVHDEKINRSVWLSYVQGFQAWGAGQPNATTGEWEKYDGLSGNQVLLFQVLDAFLGIESYLPKEVLEMNVPRLQREFVLAVGRHGFRHQLGEGEVEKQIAAEFFEIVKRLRVFRMAHRTRAKGYLTQPAPERLPMTAGKSLLKADMNESLQFLDAFMLGRLKQTV